jgi:hypothetical protein
MFPVLFPVRTIVIQALVLLLAIALESRVLHQRLVLPRQLCVIYASVMNLLSITFSWLAFFCVQPAFLPEDMKIQMLSYVILGKLPMNVGTRFIEVWAILIGFALFFITWQVKVQGLYLMQISNLLPSPISPENHNDIAHRRNYLLIKREQMVAILGAHGLSHIVLLLILVILNLQLWQ